MSKALTQSDLDKIVKSLSDHKHVFGVVLHVYSNRKNLDLISATGEMEEGSPYYVASINKFMVSALVLELSQKLRLHLNDKLSQYLSEEEMQGLHVYKGVDYSSQITITHLLSQTSGLPDYLEDKQANGRIAMKDLEAGIDQVWDTGKVITEVKQMKAHFPPGKPGKARYIDTNHQLLGLVIERITNQPLHETFDAVFRDLNMEETYVFGPKKGPFAPLYLKHDQRDIRKFLASTGYDIISTARDQMKFLRAFFDGYFYPKDKLKELEKWNRIFFPFHYGIGLQKFSIPRLFSPFKAVPAMIGHSGSTGSVAFFVPDRDVYITGTINQQAAPRLIFQNMVRILNKV